MHAIQKHYHFFDFLTFRFILKYLTFDTKTFLKHFPCLFELLLYDSNLTQKLQAVCYLQAFFSHPDPINVHGTGEKTLTHGDLEICLMRHANIEKTVTYVGVIRSKKLLVNSFCLEKANFHFC